MLLDRLWGPLEDEVTGKELSLAFQGLEVFHYLIWVLFKGCARFVKIHRVVNL